MKKGVLITLAFALVLFVVPLVSAEILMGQINTLYSKGDDFKLDITLSPSVDTRGFLEADLTCYSVASDVDVDALIASRSANESDANNTDSNNSVSDSVVQNSEISG